MAVLRTYDERGKENETWELFTAQQLPLRD
jgi:hypothetical protein